MKTLRTLANLSFFSLLAFLPGCVFVMESDGSVQGTTWWRSEGIGDWVVGSGVSATAVREVAEFRAVRCSGSLDVSVRVGEERAVRVRGDDNLIERVEAVVEDGTLHIRMRSGGYRTRLPLVVEVATPALSALSLEGSGDLRVSGLSSGTFSVHLSGSGDVRGSGAVDELEVSLSGSGDIELAELAARRANVVSAGSGDIRVNASDELSVALSGSGDVGYRGSPTLRKVVSGSGDVHALR